MPRSSCVEARPRARDGDGVQDRLANRSIRMLKCPAAGTKRAPLSAAVIFTGAGRGALFTIGAAFPADVTTRPALIGFILICFFRYFAFFVFFFSLSFSYFVFLSCLLLSSYPFLVFPLSSPFFPSLPLLPFPPGPSPTRMGCLVLLLFELK